MTHTLQEVAQITGQSYAVVKKHAQRGKLATSRDGRSVFVTEEQLNAYQTAESFERVADLLRIDDPSAYTEAGNVIARLPGPVLNAILEGVPRTGKGGHPGRSEPFKRATVGRPSKPAPAEPTDSDPHNSLPIGHTWTDAPRWQRVSDSTWELLGASWTWNGVLWEGGGSAEGRVLEPGISPASPYSHLRPASPSQRAHG